MGSAGLLAKFFGLAFSALLPLINPLGSALVFLGLVGNAPAATYRRLALRIALDTTLFLIAIEVAGTALLSFFGISLPVVQVAGGLVLASMGWSVLNEPRPRVKPDQPDVPGTSSEELSQMVFYPLTFPVTAGPGCIVVTITLSAHASVHGVFPNFMAHVGVVLAIVVLSILVFLCYGYAPRISQRIPPQTAYGVLRVIAFVLLCIGVQITWNGVESLVKSMLRT